MKLRKYWFLNYLTVRLLIAILFVALGWSFSQAAGYPDRPITTIVPFAVGGGFDTVARIVQPWLKETLGAPAVIVENRSGGMGAIGVSAFARSKADGYTLLCNDFTATVLSFMLVDNPGFEMEDLTPIVTVTYDPRYFFVRKDSPYKDMNDLVDDARKRPGRVTIAVPQGSGAHWQLEYIKKVMDLPVQTVGYTGGGPALTALLGGHVDAFESDGLGRVKVREKLRAIGVVADKKTELFPEAPPCVDQRAFKERGITHLAEAPAAVAFWVRREVKEKYPDIFKKLEVALFKVKELPDYLEKAKQLDLDKISLWDGPEKALKMKEDILEAFQGNPDIIKMMKSGK
jgi:tripartite-type tricarboxylate transporter receptor subunit TctC